MNLKHTDIGFEVLGVPLGEDDYVANVTNQKFDKIATVINKLNNLASVHPQHALTLLLKSTKHKTSYIFRTVNQAYKYASQFDRSMKILVNTLFGCDLDEKKLEEIQLPIREGGLGLGTSAVNFAQEQYDTSVALTHEITRHILFNEELPTSEKVAEHRKCIWESRIVFIKERIEKLIR